MEESLMHGDISKLHFLKGIFSSITTIIFGLLFQIDLGNK